MRTIGGPVRRPDRSAQRNLRMEVSDAHRQPWTASLGIRPDDRPCPRANGVGPSRPRCPGLPRARPAVVVDRVRPAGRTSRPGSLRAGSRAGRARGNLVDERAGVGRDAVRGGPPRRSPGQRQPGLSALRARGCLTPGRCDDARRGWCIQELGFRRHGSFRLSRGRRGERS